MIYKITSIVIIAILVGLNLRSCDQEKSTNSLLVSLGDTLTVTRDKLGREVAKSTTLSVSSAKQLLDIKSKDSSIISLQALVTDYEGQILSASHLHVVTEGTVVTRTIVRVDTVHDQGYPTYTGTFDTPWYSGSVVANKDQVTNNYRVRNKFRIIEGKESNGWFKNKVYKSTVINMNPNTATKEFTTVVVTETPKRFTFGMQIGYGLSIPTFKPTAYVGGGVNIHLIGIK
jgi:hypothetical protein